MQAILGPSGIEKWASGQVRFRKIWARGIVAAAATGTAPLLLFTRKQDDDTLPQIPAATLATAAMEEIDSAIMKENTAPFDFTATHCGIYIEPRCVWNNTVANDVAAVLADVEMIAARLWVEIYFGDQKEPFDRGLIPELPAGFGLEVEGFSTAGAVTMDQYKNGPALPGVVHALPTPARVTGSTTLRVRLVPVHGGFQVSAAHGIRFTTYGVE